MEIILLTHNSETSSGVNPYGFDIPGANILDEN